MKNKDVGYLIVGISLVIFLIIFLFNSGLNKIVSDSCSHGPECVMYQTISMQTWFSVAISVFILLIGLFFIFVKEEKEFIIKRIKPKKVSFSLNGLSLKEKQAFKLIQEKNGIFQAELKEKLGIGKVGLTRLLDKLEAKQIIERKRRGMNNFVALKQ
jgi:uncharacterized membrane protein